MKKLIQAPTTTKSISPPNSNVITVFPVLKGNGAVLVKLLAHGTVNFVSHGNFAIKALSGNAIVRRVACKRTACSPVT